MRCPSSCPLIALVGLMAWLLAACARPTPVPPTPTITVPPLPTREPTATLAAARLSPAPQQGRPAPDFTAVDLHGRPRTLSQTRGQPVVLNFWATWCPPCVEELPMLADYARRLQGRVTFVALNVDEGPARVQRFVDDMGLDTTALQVWRDAAGTLALEYRVTGFPTTFFLDEAGVIRAIRVGGMTEPELQAGLRALGVEVAP